MRRLALLLSLFLCVALPTYAQSQQATLSSASCPGTGCSTFTLSGSGSVGIQVTGTFSGTLTFYGSNINPTPGDTNFTVLNLVPLNGGTAVSTATTAGIWTGATAGISYLQVKFTSYVSGSATISLVTAMSRGPLTGSEIQSGVIAVANGGTGLATLTSHALYVGAGTANPNPLAVCGTGSYVRGVAASDPVCSTLVLPNAATQGDLLLATSANTVASLAAVATGQVLTSAGTSTAPVYSANPAVTTMTVNAGGGTGTMKASGLLCSTNAANCGAVAYTDAGVINQWNVMSLTVPASTLAVNGDALKVRVAAQLATNANTKGWQLYIGGGTCSGTGATCCATGTQVYSDGSASSNFATISDYLVTRTGASTQQVNGVTYTGPASISSVDNVSGASTDTSTMLIAYCARNTSAGAATLQGTPSMRIEYAGK